MYHHLFKDLTQANNSEIIRCHSVNTNTATTTTRKGQKIPCQLSLYTISRAKFRPNKSNSN